ncbi:MAG: hypothetical protein OXG52_05170 [bacterium]|nr:hypothetical protein [bacterium]
MTKGKQTYMCSVRRSDTGLTTLEWLLIVAAVAGLAALAVVLVQNVVDETAEEIGGSNARITAAQVAASRITGEAREELPVNKSDTKQDTGDDTNQADIDNAKARSVDREFRSKCMRLEITYSDADVDVKWWEIKIATASGNGTGKDDGSTPNGDHDDNTNPSTTPKAALCEIKDS